MQTEAQEIIDVLTALNGQSIDAAITDAEKRLRILRAVKHAVKAGSEGPKPKRSPRRKRGEAQGEAVSHGV